MSTIEIEIPARGYIYMCVQKYARHPPEGKCHILRGRCGPRVLVSHSQTPYLKVTFEYRIWLCIGRAQ